VFPEDFAMINKAAEDSHRSVSEEMIWRVRQSFVWEKAFGDAHAVVDNANRTMDKTLKDELHKELLRQGYTRIRAVDGTAWFEPGVHAIRWIWANVDAESRIVLQEMLNLAATQAVEKSRAVLQEMLDLAAARAIEKSKEA
jgi:hypothetical protein